MVNLQVSSSDIPAIADVDSDGDMDILTFRFATGNTVEYHQNQSIENNGDCCQLHYKLGNINWGNFEECSCGDYVFGTSCNDPGGWRQIVTGDLVRFDSRILASGIYLINGVSESGGRQVKMLIVP